MTSRCTGQCRPLHQFSPTWWLILPLLCLFFITSARGEDRPRVSVGIVDNNMPYSNMENGTASGFSVDILRQVALNAGVELEFQAGHWPEIYSAFLSGDIDVIDAISFRSGRAEKILFTTPYHIRQTYLMHNPDRPLGPTDSLSALSGKRLGALRDIYYLDALTQSGMQVNTYDSVAGLIRALAFGWVDGVVGPGLTLKYYARESGFPFLDIAGPAPLGELTDEDFRLGVLRGREPLHEDLQRGLDAIPETFITETLQRWRELGGANLDDGADFRLDARSQRYIGELGPLRIGFMQDYAPFSFHDAGALQGLGPDLMNRISDLTGLQVIPVSGQWSELYSAYLDGNIDIMANMSRTEEREAFTEYSDAYHDIPNVAFTLDRQLDIKQPEDLKGYRVALGAGIYYETEMRRILGDSVRSFTSQRAMFEALADGSVDVTLAALPNGNHWVRLLQIPSVRIAGEVPMGESDGEDLRFGVRKELTPVADIINQALGAITPTEMNTIKNRWLGASRAANNEAGTVSFTKAEKQWLTQRNHSLRLCLDPDWLPLEGINEEGEHIGATAVLFQLFEQRSGITFSPVVRDSWAESLAAAQNRECDLMSMAMETPGRQQLLDFTRPYLQLPTIMVGRIEAPFIGSPAELGSQPIGIVRDYALKELLENRHPNLSLVEVTSENEGLRRVQERELAAYITTSVTASHKMEELGLADLKVIGRIAADWSLSVATRSDAPVLLGIMEKLVQSLTGAEQQQIRNSWSHIELEQSVDYTLLIQIVLTALAVLALLFYWNRKLDRLNGELESANNTLARLSVTDDLTQLGNRSYFDRELKNSFAWCKRYHARFALAMIDADHFKIINDNHGHQAGDHCLKILAECMRSHFRRDTDRISRFGGEEFVVFTTYNDDDELTQRFEQLREDISQQDIEWGGKRIRFTVSIGLATGKPDENGSEAEFLRQADQALYAAKQKGRNRLEIRAL